MNFGQKMLQNYCILMPTKAFLHFPRMPRWCLISQIWLNSTTKSRTHKSHNKLWAGLALLSKELIMDSLIFGQVLLKDEWSQWQKINFLWPFEPVDVAVALVVNLVYLYWKSCPYTIIYRFKGSHKSWALVTVTSHLWGKTCPKFRESMISSTINKTVCQNLAH